MVDKSVVIKKTSTEETGKLKPQHVKKVFDVPYLRSTQVGRIYGSDCIMGDNRRKTAEITFMVFFHRLKGIGHIAGFKILYPFVVKMRLDIIKQTGECNKGKCAK